MLPFGLARTRPDILSDLAGSHKRVLIRVEQENTSAPAAIARDLARIARSVPVDAVITGNEPEVGIDMRYSSRDWGQGTAYAGLPRTKALIDAVHGLGLTAVSPAFSCSPEVISEDGWAQPGRTAWREICAPVYQEADGCAAHVYSLNWLTVADVIRFKAALRWALEAWHRPLYLDEVGTARGTQLERMGSYIEMAEVIMGHKDGERVRLLCPFVSTGTPNGQWDPDYILNDPVAYALLADWMSS